jgi:hypothetical protein
VGFLSPLTNSVNGLIFTQAKGKRILNRSVSKIKKERKPNGKRNKNAGEPKKQQRRKAIIPVCKRCGKIIRCEEANAALSFPS